MYPQRWRPDEEMISIWLRKFRKSMVGEYFNEVLRTEIYEKPSYISFRPHFSKTTNGLVPFLKIALWWTDHKRQAEQLATLEAIWVELVYSKQAVDQGIDWAMSPAILLSAFCIPLLLWPREDASAAQAHWRAPRLWRTPTESFQFDASCGNGTRVEGNDPPSASLQNTSACHIPEFKGS